MTIGPYAARQLPCNYGLVIASPVRDRFPNHSFVPGLDGIPNPNHPFFRIKLIL